MLHDRLQLAGGVKIGGGPVIAVVAGAEELFVALCTAGPALDERIRSTGSVGAYLQMLLLDELGSWAVDQLRQQLYERVQVELAERGWRTSSPLSPGESDWPMREQRIIFKLLDTAEIGVTLGPSYMMSPLKSLSVVFGAGAREMGSEGLTNCDFCSIQDRCRFTKTRDSGKDIPMPPPSSSHPRATRSGISRKKNEYDPDGQRLRDVNAGTDVRQPWSTPPDKEKKKRWNLISSAPWPT